MSFNPNTEPQINRGVHQQDYIKPVLSQEVSKVLLFSRVLTFSPSRMHSTVVGTEHLLGGILMFPKGKEEIKKLDISPEAVIRDLFMTKGSVEIRMPGYLETQKYREVVSLAAALAYQQPGSPNSQIEINHLVDAILRTKGNAAEAILQEHTRSPQIEP